MDRKEDSMKFAPFNKATFEENPFTMLSDDWMLVTAGTQEDFNTLTVAWGGFGFLWNKPVFYAVVRHSRHTFGYMEKHDRFTCQAFEEEYRGALTICGTKSGRDTDKVAEAGLTPVSVPNLEAVTFKEARLTLICRKLFSQDMEKESFIDKDLFKENYPDAKDIHRLYIGEIESINESE